MFLCFFFFKQKTAYEMRISDWSSDVCSSDLPVVNSISMKEGEAAFLEHARLCRKYGAAAVVMAFDEKGQADSLERRKQICERAYRLLVDEVGFPPEDIIFASNVFAIATGIDEQIGSASWMAKVCQDR